MEKMTGEEVNDIPSFLVASVLPIAKKKVAQVLIKEGFTKVYFKEEYICASEGYVAHIFGDMMLRGYGRGESFEKATVHAVENFIERKKEMVDG